ncbi:hypothetical protein AEA09_08475 [Lysinibacillus contaminans]|uniref:Uncharacterized protein n=1 Tax=Lysinibacillus contaminans TaxID=1293441 RepID=A0ABR5K1I5_9BACI|nr:hypothetical protein [Lysinibacillus contaminans]KOS68581.1 hypothetical protein AEA09_08475 [Lysinibacillus contaminans]
MRLTKGISGFDSEHLIEQDMQSFQSMVYHLVTSEPRAKALQFGDDPSNVYMRAMIQLDEEQFTILHHRLMPYVAFAEKEENLILNFLTKSKLHKYFPMRKCLEAAVLDTSLEQDKHLHSLSEMEWKYVKRFRSETVGEVMFNYWD